MLSITSEDNDVPICGIPKALQNPALFEEYSSIITNWEIQVDVYFSNFPFVNQGLYVPEKLDLLGNPTTTVN